MIRTTRPVPWSRSTKPGQCQRCGHECRRNGTANLFVFLDVHRPWRKVKVTERRVSAHFAACMQDLTDIHFPEARKIRVALDNLSTHRAAARCSSLPAKEARRILRRIEFHHTPRHASWLNMVEIGVLQGQCLNRRIPDRNTLEAEAAAPMKQRNEDKGRTSWMFTVDKAREKWAKPVPNPKIRNRNPEILIH